MAVIVTTTVTARCWKQHTCCACGCVYRYLLERVRAASGSPGGGAATEAAYSANRALLNGIEERPCPNCGVVQPDMVGKSKAGWHLLFTALTGTLLLLIVLPTIGGYIPLDRAGEAAAGVAIFALLGHLVVALFGPNWSLKDNQKESRDRMQAGEMAVDTDGREPNYAAMPRNLTASHLLCLVALLIAPLGFLAPRVVSGLYPMPRNEGLQPDVVGPGDSVKVPIDSPLRTYGGNWFGIATAEALNAEELGISGPLRAATHSQRWGKIISVKDSKSPLEPIQPWARVTVPDDPTLGGKTLRVRVELTITYPVDMQRGGVSVDRAARVQREVEMVLAEAGSGGLYKQAWLIGGGVGLTGCVLGGLALTLLGQALRWSAPTPRTFLL